MTTISFSVTAVVVLLVAVMASLEGVKALSSTAPKATTTTDAAAVPIVKNVAVPGLEHGMDYVMLGDSDLEVSKVCCGTMTFGEQNSIDEGVQQLHTAHDEFGINFIDTAEMYPVPTKPETQGRTDEAVAKFLNQRGKSERDNIVLATKVAGRSDRITWLPRKEPETSAALTRDQILFSVDASLQRLGVDYIDLLQLHWPDRYTGGLFGDSDFTPSKLKDSTHTSFEEQLGALQELVQAGKVRHVGVSNETPYGVCSMVELAKHNPNLYPKIVSIQNSYSLVVRKDFEAGLAEACFHNNVGLLPYSPLAGGVLTGKYSRSDIPKNARLNLFPGFMDRYLGSQNEAAVKEYCDIASHIGISPAELALSWCFHNVHVASTIIGATTMAQLQEDIKAYDIRLDEETVEKISKVYKKYTDPTKAY